MITSKDMVSAFAVVLCSAACSTTATSSVRGSHGSGGSEDEGSTTAARATEGGSGGVSGRAGGNSQPVGAGSAAGSAASAGPCSKFCSEQASLVERCPDALPRRICEGLCADPKCVVLPGCSPADVKKFFDDCVSSPSETICNSEMGSTIPQPIDCPIETLNYFTQWVNGWIYSGKPDVCQ